MATQIKKNETVVLGTHKNGVHLQFFTITFPSSGDTAKLTAVAGVRSPVAAALDAIASVASIELIGVGNGTTTINIAVAAAGGDFGTNTWNGTNSESFAAYLQRLVQASGNLQSVNNGSTTVAALVF